MTVRSRVYAAAIGIVVVYLALVSTMNFVVDDTFISLRYAENLANGQGLVYNAGERVEGYSNFLWVLALSAVMAVLPDVDAAGVARLFGILAGVTCILLIIAMSLRQRPRGLCSNVIAAVLLVSSSSFAAWSVAGLETTLFAATIVLALYAFRADTSGWKATLIAGLAASLPSLVRADGFVVFFLLTAARFHTMMRDGVGVMRRENAVWLASFAALFLPYLSFRLAYYGYPLPNTYYAKVSFGFQDYVRGAEYLAVVFFEWGALVFVFMLLPVLKRRMEPVLVASAWVAYGWLGYILTVGGDVMPFHRFVVSVAPVIFLLVQEGILELVQWSRTVEPPLDRRLVRGWAVTLVLLLSAFLAKETVLGFRNDNRRFDPYVNFVKKCEAAGRWLEANTDEGVLVAMTPAGATAYYSKRPVIDMLGLNDLHIGHLEIEGDGIAWQGHEKGDGSYVLSRRPEYVLLGNVAVEPHPLTKEELGAALLPFVSENEIWASEAFHASYEFSVRQMAESGPHRYFMFFERKD